jgi:hypothetical protein
MTRTGFDDPGRPDDDAGRGPEPLAQWLTAGFTAEEAEVWRNWRFPLATASSWRDAGVTTGLSAAQWATAGVNPATVGRWRAAGIGAPEAVTWHELGFDFGAARRHKANGVTPQEAYDRAQPSPQPVPFLPPPGFPRPPLAALRATARMPHPYQRFATAGISPPIVQTYVARQWLDDEAVAWGKAGIDAASAELWKALGLRAVEAGRLVRQGSSVVDVVRQWWQAGVPIDEVADWIGAGLTATEAADQRARGISVEQAATLRALRDEPGLD